jgi:LmbE family N-acetylglucosaminyl deacetylase
MNQATTILTCSESDKSITIFAPHPDDEIFGCGGLLGLLESQGKKLRVIIVSDGGFGEFGRDTAARKNESLAAASILGNAKVEFWDLPDQGLSSIPDLQERFRSELESNPCQLLLTPSPWEIHPDHLAVCRAVCDAWRMLEVPPQIAFYEIGAPMPQAFIIDISSMAEKKRAAMECFVSQNAIQDYAKQIGGLNTYRGYTLSQRGAWGEAFFLPDPSLLRVRGEEKLAEMLAGQGLINAVREPLDDDLARLISENQRLSAECQALRQSTSWRITAPLRAIATWFKQKFKAP